MFRERAAGHGGLPVFVRADIQALAAVVWSSRAQILDGGPWLGVGEVSGQQGRRASQLPGAARKFPTLERFRVSASQMPVDDS